MKDLYRRARVLPPADSSRPLILADGEGERRVHRPPPGGLSNLAAPFIIKVARRNGGAPEFVLCTEDIPPGQAIPPHHHPDADEILRAAAEHRYRAAANSGDLLAARI